MPCHAAAVAVGGGGGGQGHRAGCLAARPGPRPCPRRPRAPNPMRYPGNRISLGLPPGTTARVPDPPPSTSSRLPPTRSTPAPAPRPPTCGSPAAATARWSSACTVRGRGGQGGRLEAGTCARAGGGGGTWGRRCGARPPAPARLQAGAPPQPPSPPHKTTARQLERLHLLLHLRRRVPHQPGAAGLAAQRGGGPAPRPLVPARLLRQRSAGCT